MVIIVINNKDILLFSIDIYILTPKFCANYVRDFNELYVYGYFSFIIAIMTDIGGGG